jgi:hypothetical protein
MKKLASCFTGFIVLLAFGVVMSVHSDARAGETKDHGRYVSAKAEFEIVKVGDVDGHVVGSYYQTGVSFRGEEITTRSTGGTFDYVNWAGPVRGSTVETYKDGSTHTVQWEGEAKFDSNKNRYFEGTYECVAGTGRLKGIQCKGTWKLSSEANGMGVGEWNGTVTLPN